MEFNYDTIIYRLHVTLTEMQPNTGFCHKLYQNAQINKFDIP